MEENKKNKIDEVYHYDEPDEYDDAGDETGGYEEPEEFAATDEPEAYDDRYDDGYDNGIEEMSRDDMPEDVTVQRTAEKKVNANKANSNKANPDKANSDKVNPDKENSDKKKTVKKVSAPRVAAKKNPAAEETNGRVQTELRQAHRRIRELEVKSNRMKLLLVIWIILAVVFATLFIREKLKDSYYGKVVDVESTFNEKLALAGPEGLTELFTENYVKYLKKAYVLFGTYPDCSYYKVAAGVRRDDYDFENDFYTPEGELYKYYCPDGVKSSKVAIDVSTYQTDVNWEEVKNSGVDVVIVRSGFRGYGEEGKLVEDSQFKNHIEGALAAGLECGVYFFTEAISYEEGAEEARYVLEQIKDYNITQPIIVDTEKISQEGVRANDIDNETRTQALLGFCETIEAAGRTPMIYASTAWFCQAMDIAKLGKYEFWLAAYGTPQFPYHVEGWQYDPEGSVPGIEGNVDLNVWLR